MDSKAVNDVIESAAGISLITPDRLRNLAAAVQRTIGLHADMAELGVYRGGSAKVIAAVRPGATLHLFDTFTGLPYSESAEHNPTGHDLHEGRFSCDWRQAERFLQGFDVVFHIGVFPASAQTIEPYSFSFVHVDCDLYQSAADAIEFFWPRMLAGGIMYFDDYGCDFTGVTDAVNEHFPPNMIERQVEASNGIAIGALVVKR
jgi:Macrocin-O-methyltransferase (TylF).